MTEPSTYGNWFATFLTKLGAPVTSTNLTALADVTHFEGLNDRYNPLNSVEQSGNSTSFNSVNVQDYKSADNGIAGTLALFQNNSVWNGVVAALKQGNSTDAVLNAEAQVYSGWDPGVTGSSFQTDAGTVSSILGQSMGPSQLTSGAIAGGGTAPTHKTNPLTPVVGVAKAGTDIAAGGVSAATTAAASAVEGAVMDGLKAIAGPIEKFLISAAAVIFGLILIIVAIILLSHSGDSNSAPQQPGPMSSSKTEREDPGGGGAEGDVAETAEEGAELGA